MPLPFIIGGLAVVAGATGLGEGISGGMKMGKARNTAKLAQAKYDSAINRFKTNSEITTVVMDKLGKIELETLTSFEKFSDLIEKIQNRPRFKEIDISDVILPEYRAEELKQVSLGAGVLLGGLGGAAVGTAGGFAAAGATTSAVMALGTASTGTAIASLSGAAATNATLAALGGGALAAGGGGMALGTAVLGGATLGVGLMFGGIIFKMTGKKLSTQADEAMQQAMEIEEKVEQICSYLNELQSVAREYINTLKTVKAEYESRLKILECLVGFMGKCDWEEFTEKEKAVGCDLVLLVGLLFKMCQLELVNKVDDTKNEVNSEEASKIISAAENVLENELREVA